MTKKTNNTKKGQKISVSDPYHFDADADPDTNKITDFFKKKLYFYTFG